MVSKEKSLFLKVVFKTNQILTLLKVQLCSNQDHRNCQVERNVIKLRPFCHFDEGDPSKANGRSKSHKLLIFVALVCCSRYVISPSSK